RHESGKWLKSTTSLYLKTKSDFKAKRTAQAMVIISRICPTMKDKIQKYFDQRSGYFVDRSLLFTTMTTGCQSIELLKEFFQGFAKTSAKVLLFVTRL
ncbi:hypothetical protein PFISCL1PPCAC_2953, partial [Pristionchus fissidentatus]